MTNISEHLFHSDQNVRYPMSEFPGFWAKRASSLVSVVRSFTVFLSRCFLDYSATGRMHS